MRPSARPLAALACAVLATGALTAGSTATAPPASAHAAPTRSLDSAVSADSARASHSARPAHSARPTGETVRVAAFGVDLSGSAPGRAAQEIDDPHSPLGQRARRAAAIISASGADVVVVTGLDTGPQGAGEAFRRLLPREYAHAVEGPVVNGLRSTSPLHAPRGVDEDRTLLAPGAFPGQGGMLLVSRLPVDAERVRTFSAYRWRDLQGASLPDDPTTETPADYYSPTALAQLPLSTSGIWDVPVLRRGRPVHVVAVAVARPRTAAEDPTPELRRHADQLALVRALVSSRPRTSPTPVLGPGGPAALPSPSGLRDDEGHRGGLPQGEPFVIAGTLGADPEDSGAFSAAVRTTTTDPTLTDPHPSSEGASEASDVQGRDNQSQSGPADEDTFDGPDAPGASQGPRVPGERGGNVRLDYVLPSSDMEVRGSGVFWPRIGEHGAELTGVAPLKSSRHRLVWADVR